MLICRHAGRAGAFAFFVPRTPRSHFDAYLIGGGAFYRRTQEFTQPSLAAVTAFDPFFGFYTAAVPTTQVLSSYTVNKPGVNGGAGIAFGSSGTASFLPKLVIMHLREQLSPY